MLRHPIIWEIYFTISASMSDAISNWELSVGLDDSFPTALRNLGIAYFNKLNDAEKALELF
jgi:hypothetical protein